MAISYFSEDTKFSLKEKRKITRWLKLCIEDHGKTLGDLTFIFCSDRHLLSINQQYLKHSYYTDVITFDYSEELTISGDIFISVDTVLENSVTFNKEFLDELHRVIIHGVLHLCGFGDKSEPESKQMRLLEDTCLSLLLSE